MTNYASPILSFLVNVKTDGSLTPVIISLVFALILAWGAAFGLSWLLAPSKIRHSLRNKGMGLPELRDKLRLGAGTFLLAIGISLLMTLALAFLFYSTLYQQSYMGSALWVPLTNSWLSTDILFSNYRPMPWGVLLAFFTGWMVGHMLGIGMGRRTAAAGFLLTHRLYNPVKSH
ncbi:MAG: hypothetical protein B9S30_06725 [Verrucomicrobiia bacterium Tous-C5FEB]|nr:MAG: hypothetical protein B9S30_06725 [Verrucomicrobiae bacterium Tous-C5FEB]